MDKDIVSTKEEDKPLIYISEEAINLKRDNDKYKKEIERLKEENTILKQTMSNNSLLINENAFLKERIEKAIEYIEEKVGNEIHDMMYVIDVSELLDILKGVDKKWD